MMFLSTFRKPLSVKAKTYSYFFWRFSLQKKLERLPFSFSKSPPLVNFYDIIFWLTIQKFSKFILSANVHTANSKNVEKKGNRSLKEGAIDFESQILYRSLIGRRGSRNFSRGGADF